MRHWHEAAAVFDMLLAMTSVCSPIICRWMPIRNWATMPSSGAELGYVETGRFGEQKIGMRGTAFVRDSDLGELRMNIERVLSASRC